MKAKAIITTNLQEMTQAHNMAMKCEPQTENCQMLFRPEHVVFACHIHSKNKILICIAGREIEIDYDEYTWERLNQIMPT